MAKLTVHRSCGHSETVVRFGGHYEQQIASLEKGVCQQCYFEQKRTEPPRAHVRMIDSGLEINVVNSYPVKDALKSRGYRWYPDYYEPRVGALGGVMNILQKPTGAWSKTLGTDVKSAENELMYLQTDLKSQIVFDSTIAGLISAIVEGRPDLLGLTRESL